MNQLSRNLYKKTLHDCILKKSLRSFSNIPPLFENQESHFKNPTTTTTTHFGFQTVAEDEKEHLVRKVFSNVASKYDLMNDVMSAGIHRLWKDHFVHTVAPTPFSNVLDVAGGTGDIAFRMLDYVKRRNGDALGELNIKVLDINKEMLQVGEQKLQKHYPNASSHLQFIQGNAESLKDIPDESIDVYTIAFGIRNCTHNDRVLSEAYRVLKPGGKFTCLEFSHVQHPLLKMVYDRYSFDLIPTMGDWIAQDRHSYQYLVESIRRFPRQDEFANMIKKTGFTVIGSGYEDLTFGIAAIHSGWKL